MVEKSNVMEYSEIIYQIDFHLKRIGWSKKKAVEHIKFYYSVKSRIHLNDFQLLEFLDFLKSTESQKSLQLKLPSFKPLKIKRYGEF